MTFLQDTPARNQDEANLSRSRQSSGTLLLGSNSQSLSRALFSSEDTETKCSGRGSGGDGSGAAGETVRIDPPPDIGIEPPPLDDDLESGDKSSAPPPRRIRRRSSLVLGPTGFSAALAFLPPMSGAPNSNSEVPARSL